MRIGIDIDDTTTDTWKYMIPIFSKIFNIQEKELKKSKPYYHSLKNIITKEEYFKILNPIYDNIIINVPLKKHVKKVLDKLINEGHEIYFITSRTEKETSNPYEITYNYLKKHHLNFNKLIINGRDKAKICQKEKIDLFIDDSNKHCSMVAATGIKVLMFKTSYNKNLDFEYVSSWMDIYDYIERR